MKITLDEKQRVGVSERKHVPLFSTVPDNEAIARLVEKHKEAQAARVVQKQKERQKELMDGLELIPEEFTKRYRKKQTDIAEGAADETECTKAIGGSVLPDCHLVRVRRFIPRPAKQETLEERVKNYMQAQIDGKWDRVYSFFDSSSRQKISRESYVQGKNLSLPADSG